MSEHDWFEDIGHAMVEYIYDGEYYILPDGSKTKERPGSAEKKEANALKIPLHFWFTSRI